jgi:hypothetical protein
MRFLSILLFVPMLGFATEKMSFDVRVDAYAQPVSVKAFTDDWQDALQAGDSAFLQGRVETIDRKRIPKNKLIMAI